MCLVVKSSNIPAPLAYLTAVRRSQHGFPAITESLFAPHHPLQSIVCMCPQLRMAQGGFHTPLRKSAVKCQLKPYAGWEAQPCIAFAKNIVALSKWGPPHPITFILKCPGAAARNKATEGSLRAQTPSSPLLNGSSVTLTTRG
jgi:hypothetical protein